MIVIMWGCLELEGSIVDIKEGRWGIRCRWGWGWEYLWSEWQHGEPDHCRYLEHLNRWGMGVVERKRARLWEGFG